MHFRAVLLCMLLAPSVQAIEAYSCRNGFFPAFAGQVQQAELVADSGQRVHFRDDAAGCPEDESCLQKAYLVDGDRLLVGNQADGWACVWYFAEKREFVGWLPASHIDIEASQTPTADDWIGRWVPIAGSNSIVISRPSPAGPLFAEGDATWYGGLNSHGERIVHVGAFAGEARPSGDLLKIAEGDDDYDCSVTLQYVAGNLVVTDNSHCGGMNVRFDDVYREAP
ncbi:hypothetical protein [Pseudomonas sp. SST3]|uniref:hypothetical protein n=1 Tax=Pseudomonas sp. SST3 TaxID=2267882 RepID=UPI000E057BC8|nr:hypothetical protein [Pseudomonas sp. SST3]NKQ09381.1 hypothetical protein [Pseudomonas sp. SST3]